MLVIVADEYAAKHNADQLIADKIAGSNKSGQDEHSNDNSKESGEHQGDKGKNDHIIMIKMK